MGVGRCGSRERKLAVFATALTVFTVTFPRPGLATPDPNSVLRRCFVALTLLSSGIPANPPGRYFREPIDPTVVQVPAEASNPAKARTVNLVTHLTRENVDQIFSHQYNADLPHVRGAKGLVFHGFDGRTHVVLWPTGSGRSGNEVHHTDVTASILRHEAALLRRAAEGPVLEREFAQSRERLRDGTSVRYLTLATELENIARDLHDVRRHDAMPEVLLIRFQGFQMSAEVGRDGHVTAVTKLEISSRLTAAQVSKGVQLGAGKFNLELKMIYSAIPPELRKWRRVEVEGWDRLQFDERSRVVEPGTTRPPIALVP
jgi:hypothetical protein